METSLWVWGGVYMVLHLCGSGEECIWYCISVGLGRSVYGTASLWVWGGVYMVLHLCESGEECIYTTIYLDTI